MGGGAGYEGHRTRRGNATPVLGREVIYRLDVITCIAVKEAARRPAMYRIGSYQYVFRPCYPPGEPRRLDTWSECTADVQSARLGPDGISREYRRGRSGIPVSRRYLRNVARCTVERPSKRPSSYMPKLSIKEFWHVTRRSLRRSFDATSCHVAELPSRYRNSRQSPTVFSGCTVGPESSGPYIGCAFRPRLAPGGLPRGLARPERVFVRPDVVQPFSKKPRTRLGSTMT